MVTHSQGSYSAPVTTPQREPFASANQPNTLPLAGPSRGQLLTIKAACQLVGVDRSTLRRWSNAGKIPVYRTPGGHRRYREADLRALIGDGGRYQGRPRPAAPAADGRLHVGSNGTSEREVRRPWYAACSPSVLDELRRIGHRLKDVTIRYAATSAVEGRDRLLAEGRQIGEVYGRTSFQAGLSVSEMVEAFLSLRKPINRAIASLVEESDLSAQRLARLCNEAGQFEEDVLLATIRAYEAAALNGESGCA